MSEAIRIPVDVTNPGQFFACCGLLELAARLWPDATGRYSDDAHFEIAGAPNGATLQALVEELEKVGLTGALTPELARERDALEKEKKSLKKNGLKLPAEKEKRRNELGGILRAGSIFVNVPFRLVMDWWQGDSDDIPKPWAGTMQVRRIAVAALSECRNAFEQPPPLGYACVLRPIDEEDNADDDKAENEGKAEPFYFDSTRGTNASPLDIGFSPNKLSVARAGLVSRSGKIKVKQAKMESAAFPVVELFALVGLQRFRPMPTDRPRVFDYCTWSIWLPPSVAAAAVCGLLQGAGGRRFRFENAFRTDQRKHKGFLPAREITVIDGGFQ